MTLAALSLLAGAFAIVWWEIRQKKLHDERMEGLSRELDEALKLLDQALTEYQEAEATALALPPPSPVESRTLH